MRKIKKQTVLAFTARTVASTPPDVIIIILLTGYK